MYAFVLIALIRVRELIRLQHLMGTLTDNLSTTQNANCSVTGNTPNSWALQHFFHSYNSLTAEVTYKALLFQSYML